MITDQTRSFPHDLIAPIAYRIWNETGRESGREQQHWEMLRYHLPVSRVIQDYNLTKAPPCRCEPREREYCYVAIQIKTQKRRSGEANACRV